MSDEVKELLQKVLEGQEKILKESDLSKKPKELEDLLDTYQRSGVQGALRFFPHFHVLIWIIYVACLLRSGRDWFCWY